MFWLKAQVPHEFREALWATKPPHRPKDQVHVPAGLGDGRAAAAALEALWALQRVSGCGNVACVARGVVLTLARFCAGFVGVALHMCGCVCLHRSLHCTSACSHSGLREGGVRASADCALAPSGQY